MPRFCYALTLCVLTFSLGCQTQEPAKPIAVEPLAKDAKPPAKDVKPAVESPLESKSAESPKQKPAETIIQVTAVDADSFAAALKKHEGRVILIDYWATWCAPCLKRFPETVELFRKYADQGLVVISFSIDDPEDLDSVQAFLAQQKHEFAIKGEHFISKFGAGSKTEKAFDVGAVPDFRIYDRQGKLRRRWKEEEIVDLKEEQIVEEIEKALAEPK